MTDLEKSLSVLNDLLHYFREAVMGIPKGQFEKDRQFEEDMKLKEFWLHPELFTGNESRLIQGIIDNCYGLAQDVDVVELLKFDKAVKLRLEGIDEEKVEKELGVGVLEV